MKALSSRQFQILDFIIKTVEETGSTPAIREIGPAFGISSLRGVTVHLDALEWKGYIRRDKNTHRLVIRKDSKGQLGRFIWTPINGQLSE
jgi:repressor LexA